MLAAKPSTQASERSKSTQTMPKVSLVKRFHNRQFQENICFFCEFVKYVKQKKKHRVRIFLTIKLIMRLFR